ncbi:hypothetical protein M9435_005175 [Picochlorum sp. BPE23]|nr:hypothetical protein M9435_005175 [Picochlorum sp. BPE23]
MRFHVLYISLSNIESMWYVRPFSTGFQQIRQSSRLSSIKFRLSGPSNVTRVHLRSDEARISHRGGRLETLLVDPTFDCRSI